MKPLVNPLGTGEAQDWWIEKQGRFHTSLLRFDDLFWPYSVLGLTRLQVQRDALCLTWDSDRVTPEALDNARDMLESLGPAQPIRLFFRKGAWAQERLAGAQAALDRIEQIMAYRGVEVAPVTTIRRRSLEEATTMAPTIRRAYAAWQENHDPAEWPGTPAWQHGLIVQPQDNDLIFRQVGAYSDCRRVLGDQWRDQAIGTSFNAAFDDPAFNERTTESCWLAMKHRQPIFEDVNAHICLGNQDTWLRYQRTLLPGDEELVVVTRITNDVLVSFLGSVS